MLELTLIVEAPPSSTGNGEAAAEVEVEDFRRELQKGLEALPGIEAAATEVPDTTRSTMMDILAIITIAAQMAHVARGMAGDARGIAEEIAGITTALKAVFSDVAELAAKLKVKVFVPVGGPNKPIDELDDEDVREIAEDLVKPAGPG